MYPSCRPLISCVFVKLWLLSTPRAAFKYPCWLRITAVARSSVMIEVRRNIVILTMMSFAFDDRQNMFKTILCLNFCISSSFAYENLALNKPAHEEYPYHFGDTDASNAVDGLKSDLSGLGGQCSVSANNQRTSTWWVNLTSTRSIHDIRIYFRTDNVYWDASNGYTSRFLGFSIYASNTTNKLEGQLCYKDTNFTRSTIPAVFNTTCFVHGQYVIYYNERLPGVIYPSGYSVYAFNELCEVEVYGCPTPGYYGNNCTIPCPDDNCGYCHIETGTCQGGCKPGYKGHKCELECINNKYGDGCQTNCGHCFNMSQCHHINGTCFDGCDPGYEGQNCNQECQNRSYGYRCQRKCGHCLYNSQCDHVIGTCLQGCEEGYGGRTCNLVNLALRKPAYEVNLYRHPNVNASNAVDGRKSNLMGTGGECSISDGRQRIATWWVNLQSIYSIHNIRIYHRTENVAWGPFNGHTTRFLGFSLYVSNTTDKSEGKLCYKDRNFTRSTIPAVFNTTCFVHGQYVIYYNERLQGVTYPSGYSDYAFNELCEVEVYGCPRPGYYGIDCNLPCPDVNCRYCHIETGTCQGCKPGYKGHHCELEQKSCIEEKTDGILWKTTFAGRNEEIPCPENQKGVATRFCDVHGEWKLPNLINCTNEALVNASSLLDSIIANETQDKFRIQKTVNNTLQLMKSLTSSNSGISAGDLSSSLGVLEKIVTVTNATRSVIEKEVFYAVIDNILSPNNSNSWTTISEQTENGPTFLLKNMDRFSKITLQNDNITTTKFNGFNFELVINRANIDETGIRFPDEQSNKVSPNPEESLTFLELPKQASKATKAINYVAVLYKTMSDILGSDSNSKELKGKQPKKSKQRSFVNSPILSLTTQTDLGVLDPPLNLRFGHTVKNESTEMRALCVSWDFNLNKWSEEGCTVIQTDRQRTVCHCNHLTNFAILMRPYTQVSEESPFLKTMSLVGIALSIAFTFLTSLIYILTWRFIRSDKNIMMLNICGSLILSYTIFISLVEQTANEVACVAITAIIHYLFLVTFFSMLGLGVYYFMSITVTYYALYVANNFKSKSRVRWFLSGIWGIPVIITATNLGAFWGKGYHLKSYCWLSIESGSLYLFIIPVCLISLINILIIVSLLRVLFASSIVARSSLQRKASSGLRSLGTLLPVLGVTWLFGILAVNENAVVFQYLFVIANSFQGFFIFVSHVLLDKKVRQGIWNRYPTLSTILSFTERGTKETTLSSQSPSTSKSNEPLMKPKKKSLLKRFRQTKVKKSALSMSEKKMSTSCPQSVSHAKRNETNSD